MAGGSVALDLQFLRKNENRAALVEVRPLSGSRLPRPAAAAVAAAAAAPASPPVSVESLTGLVAGTTRDVAVGERVRAQTGPVGPSSVISSEPSSSSLIVAHNLFQQRGAV